MFLSPISAGIPRGLIEAPRWSRGNDVAVYRAACEAHARIEAAGGRVTRIRIDAELKAQIAGQAERARQTPWPGGGGGGAAMGRGGKS